MKLIAIETSADICSVAYIIDGSCINVVEERIPRQHAELLPVYFDDLQQQTKLKFNEIDAIAVSIGPGSFTGLRIGLSYAKGLAYSHAKPIIPVPTLEALLHGSNTNHKNAIVIISSHRNIYYIQRFNKITRDNSVNAIPIELNKIDELSDISSDTIIIQYGCEKLFEESTLSYKTVIPSSKWIGELSDMYYEKWIQNDPFKIVPQYISPFKIG